jgi:hypothetical protein
VILNPKLSNMASNMSLKFQDLLTFLGEPSVLESFAHFCGRSGMEYMDVETKIYHDQNFALFQLSRVPRRIETTTKTFCGIHFNGAHFKGIESGDVRVIYDSYVAGLQLPQTNNFCQSYATMLWAIHGDLTKEVNGHTFIPGDYVGNIQKMSQLWLDWFSVQDKKWLKQVSAGFNMNEIKLTLKQMIADKNVARDLSSSKQ